MFVVSFKMTAKKVGCVAAALAIIIAAAVWPKSREVKASTSGRENTNITTNEKRMAFLESYGWKVDENPIEVVEVTVPQVFNTVYNNYNTIQKEQGFDLSRYKGKRVKRWSYTVTNYPAGKTGIRADLLIYNGTVVGGDVCTVALNGFMHGLTLPQNYGISEAAVQDIAPSQANIISGVTDITLT